MAKKKESFSFSKVGGLLDNISKKVPIIIEDEVKEKKFISTGCYLLDAALSARLLKGGIQAGRIFGLLGDSGTGKSFIAYSICKSAQEDGYSVIYIDTENSIDLDTIQNFGIDNSPEKLRLIRSNKVEDINITLTQLLEELKNVKTSGQETPDILIVLDSIGMMSSNKEKEDLVSGKLKQDMTRAKGLNALFRSISSDLGYLDIPMVCCNHTYLTQDLFPKEVSKGGKGLVYSASVLGFLSKSKLKDNNVDDMDLGASGINVLFKTQKNRLAKPKKIRFDISFLTGLNKYSGLENFCRPEYFDTVGVAKGKMEVDKKTGEMTFKPGGNRWYVNHLDKTVTKGQLHTSEVFTPEVLKALEPIVNDYFRFNTLDEIENTQKDFERNLNDADDFSDDADAADLFE
jgi:RecA/RadA recombinase